MADGSITLTTVTLLGPHLTEANHRTLLDTACHKSRREVEELVAALRPKPDAPASVRKLPTPKRAEPVPLPAVDDDGRPASIAPWAVPRPPTRPPVVAALAPERYKVQFTVSAETYENLRRAQNLLRHTVPTGDVAAVFDRALRLLLADLERSKLSATAHPRTPSRLAAGTRHIPAAVKRAVWKRDGGQCAFVGTSGRCAERGFLEFHHVVPYATGGQASVSNVSLRCRSHNQYEAAQELGAHRRTARPRADAHEAEQPWLLRERPSSYASACRRASAVFLGDATRFEPSGGRQARSCHAPTRAQVMG